MSTILDSLFSLLIVIRIAISLIVSYIDLEKAINLLLIDSFNRENRRLIKSRLRKLSKFGSRDMVT